ncbi:unnamed protein product [Cuscuta epithymum]|uniref:Uncharacterized protein n=1 Tax=Cuscuta epithymum TaxID=186058 RepID=A0AAV0FNN5_9ASTE|nr:unnamed protein product [Cuscuta epithymum]
MKKGAMENDLGDQGVVCSNTKFEDYVTVDTVSSMLFEEDLFLNGYLSSSISPLDTECFNREIVTLREECPKDVPREAEEDIVREVMHATPIQVSLPMQIEHRVIKGVSQSDSDDASDGSSGYDSDKELLARLSDPNYKTATQIELRRSARLQAKNKGC